MVICKTMLIEGGTNGVPHWIPPIRLGICKNWGRGEIFTKIKNQSYRNRWLKGSALLIRPN
jgi:hypothetical protein